MDLEKLSTQERDLWTRLDAYQVDTGADPLSFIERLKREHGWSDKFAHRALDEYKRFVFLMMTRDKRLLPSDAVEQVWRLHLCYTKEYRERFCRHLFGKYLDFSPVFGTLEHADENKMAYSDTLLLYEEVFGKKPPRRLWRKVEDRFTTDAYATRVHARGWLVVRPVLLVVLVGGLATAGFFAARWIAFSEMGEQAIRAWLFILVPLFVLLSLAMVRLAAPGAKNRRPPKPPKEKDDEELSHGGARAVSTTPAAAESATENVEPVEEAEAASGAEEPAEDVEPAAEEPKEERLRKNFVEPESPAPAKEAPAERSFVDQMPDDGEPLAEEEPRREQGESADARLAAALKQVEDEVHTGREEPPEAAKPEAEVPEKAADEPNAPKAEPGPKPAADSWEEKLARVAREVEASKKGKKRAQEDERKGGAEPKP